MEEIFASLHVNLQRLVITQLGEPGTVTDYIAEWPLAMQQVLRRISALPTPQKSCASFDSVHSNSMVACIVSSCMSVCGLMSVGSVY